MAADGLSCGPAQPSYPHSALDCVLLLFEGVPCIHPLCGVVRVRNWLALRFTSTFEGAAEP